MTMTAANILSALKPGLMLWGRTNVSREPDSEVIERLEDGRWVLENRQGVQLAFTEVQIETYWRLAPDPEWLDRANARADDRGALYALSAAAAGEEGREQP
jgi:hypothetical protein